MLEERRSKYEPYLCQGLSSIQAIGCEPSSTLESDSPESHLLKSLPDQPPLKFVKTSSNKESSSVKVGVVFSGGQASGGHNVIAGLYDALKALNPNSQLFGFTNGPSGILKNEKIEVTKDLINEYRNTGGFNLLGSGRTKIESDEDFEKAAATCQKENLDGLVIIGGDDSNTNAALLANYFKEKGVQTVVNGVPKTIDGDLRADGVEISFGFDTATKTYSSTIGDIARDILSAKKYYFFIKLMGRSASHITLEAALRTQPNLVLIGEQIKATNRTLSDIADEIVELIVERSKVGKDYGLILIPEGIIEFIPEVGVLIQELNAILADKDKLKFLAKNPIYEIKKRLSLESKKCFSELPEMIQTQLLEDRDPHGNVQVSRIDTEKLFILLAKEKLQAKAKKGIYKGKFSAQSFFCGYEGRSSFPSNFDASYCYNLGYISALLVSHQKTGYIAGVRNLNKKPDQWEPVAVPLKPMIHLEQRKGKSVPVIAKAMVDLDSQAYKDYLNKCNQWAVEDAYLQPGPIQFTGDDAIKGPLTIG